MNTKRSIGILFTLILLLLGSMSVNAQNTSYSHSNETEPDYAVVFPQDAVNTITITISPENWAAMQEDITNLFGEFGAGVIWALEVDNHRTEARCQKVSSHQTEVKCQKASNRQMAVNYQKVSSHLKAGWAVFPVA